MQNYLSAVAKPLIIILVSPGIVFYALSIMHRRVLWNLVPYRIPEYYFVISRYYVKCTGYYINAAEWFDKTTQYYIDYTKRYDTHT